MLIIVYNRRIFKMKGILIKQKEGHKMDGKGETLGKDFEGNS